MIAVPNHIVAFKSDELRKDFDKVQPRLQAFILADGSFVYFKYGITLIGTGLLRDNMKSVHGHGNGVDFRTSNLSELQGDALVEFLKWQFPYYVKTPMPSKARYSIRDERKPHTSDDWTGSHIHGQVNWREA